MRIILLWKVSLCGTSFEDFSMTKLMVCLKTCYDHTIRNKNLKCLKKYRAPQYICRSSEQLKTQSTVLKIISSYNIYMAKYWKGFMIKSTKEWLNHFCNLQNSFFYPDNCWSKVTGLTDSLWVIIWTKGLPTADWINLLYGALVVQVKHVNDPCVHCKRARVHPVDDL